MKNIFVGNLAFTATKEDVKKLFETFGTVASVIMVQGKKKHRGFCFVDMPNEEQATAAITGLDGKDFMERPLKISRARPMIKPEYKPKRRDFKSYRRDDREVKPWDNKSSSKPFNKFGGSSSASKPWVKRESGPRSYRDDRESKPWEKTKSSSKPFNKFGGSSSASKPWVKREAGPRSYRDDRESKPWDKSKSSSKPSFNKFSGPSSTKPWEKKKSGPKKVRSAD